ncbi:uncharacterized protein NECHADRAFT_84348 [Fusarium vanettenii 77-13-4]|uniref:LysM domain-containing protein n=1 Tax=Fusarium vanettenii (strain ATCC MYA-4622 / CBS 123669 / FGSC 9596 / NRRL 45880 / 77-13-4) TaxID=660122 RepID=C7ZCV1_FUSV7|nr:uncharacterized protein NECHADRAFT_84348 [Fusarium vanettenii 77-13-4]EEU38109.1 hypothetical protein NECHADRAFT_84348 [Fusarium vanettenii 77-13-4]
MLPSIIYFLIPATIALHLPPGYHAGLLQRAEEKAPVPSDTITSCTFRYTTESSEGCDYVEEYWGVSHKDFVAWNPRTFPNAQWHGCGLQQVASCQKGDTCDTITKEYGLTTKEFVKWNPALKDDCSGLWAKYYFCVSIPEHKTATTSASTASLARPTSTSPSAATQEGITKDCTTWHIAKKGQLCDKVIAQYGNLDIATFVEWNPAVEDDCSGLWSGYAYCVVNHLANIRTEGTKTNPTKRPVPASTKEKPVATENPTPTDCETTHPSPTQPGTICNCTKWHKVTGTDGCWNLIKRYKITEKQFDAWNQKADFTRVTFQFADTGIYSSRVEGVMTQHSSYNPGEWPKPTTEIMKAHKILYSVENLSISCQRCHGVENG